MKVFVFSIFVTCLLSCQESSITSNSTLRISVNCNSMESINASEYFENVKVIPLETTKESLIFAINRLYFYKDSMYVLDKKQKSIFVFAPNGMFIRKICHIGKGPGEYMQVSDFTIDENNNEILICAEIPKAVFKYDLTGNFIKSFKVNNCYGARISTVRNKIVLASVNEEYDFVLHEYNKNTGKFIKSRIEKCINSCQYPQIDSHFPNLVKSSGAYYNQPISGEIYSIDDSVNFSKYSIDFGSNNLPFDIGGKLHDFDLIEFCIDNNCKSQISGFRVNEKFINFRYEPCAYVLYNKVSKSTKVFQRIKNENTQFDINNIFPHDGLYNGIISILEPSIVLTKLAYIKENKLEVIDSSIIKLQYNLKENDNPIIFRYAFK